MLMALRYDSSRFTKDADFSTREKYAKGDEAALLAELDAQLILANDQLPYDVLCRRQKAEMRPARPDADFPTLGLGPVNTKDARCVVLQKALSKAQNEAGVGPRRGFATPRKAF